MALLSRFNMLLMGPAPECRSSFCLRTRFHFRPWDEPEVFLWLSWPAFIGAATRLLSILPEPAVLLDRQINFAFPQDDEAISLKR